MWDNSWALFYFEPYWQSVKWEYVAVSLLLYYEVTVTSFLSSVGLF